MKKHSQIPGNVLLLGTAALCLGLVFLMYEVVTYAPSALKRELVCASLHLTGVVAFVLAIKRKARS